MSLLASPSFRARFPALPEALAHRPEFVAAARHSRRVRWLKRLIPFACGGLVLFLLARTVLGFLVSVPVNIAGSVSIEDRKIVVEKPKLSGFRRDGSSYEVNAQKALQDLRNPNVVEMFTLSARVQQGRQSWTDFSGDGGTYDSKAEKLNLRGNVRVKSDTGTEAKLEEAEIEFRAGTVVSNKPVEVRMQAGQISADSLQVLENGHKFVFEGRVHSEFVNAAPAGKTEP
ncbi:MAG: LPS export ABC transporter periplasmic protein LptC [Methylobacterium sp.]|nr:LPS export ABC transporter periplasmic protein LptC [Methylobacterium sp.]